MDYSDELIKNLDKLHSTPMGYDRIKKNIGLSGDDLEIIFQCKKMILNPQSKSKGMEKIGMCNLMM